MNRVFSHLLRGFALFLGLFALANLGLIAWGRPGYDANIWWVDLRWLPSPLAHLGCLCFALALIHFAVSPHRGSSRLLQTRRATLLLLAACLLANSLVVWRLHLTPGNGVTLGFPVPLTLLTGMLVGAMAVIPGAEQHRDPVGPWRSRMAATLVIAGGCGAAALLAPLAQMAGYGKTASRRPADVIVVYGCRAYADGRPSQALADRVNTACELYHAGLAPRIVMSGGPGDGAVHETQAMKDYAIALGVPAEAVFRDNHGLDTQATADNLRAVVLGAAPSVASPRVLAVSHDYHTPRVKLSLEREGFRAYTVPAEIRRGLPSKPYLMARETAAWWYYWGNP